jgi:predicted enzyme related to lactoylglutathione lyase
MLQLAAPSPRSHAAMTDPRTQPAGTLAGFDLTVPDAAPLRDFYASVVGWAPMEVDMGSYADFVMTAPATGAWVAGLCHARGGNADLPPQWLAYVLVDDLEASRARLAWPAAARCSPRSRARAARRATA